jgi:hypothetical protein
LEDERILIVVTSVGVIAEDKSDVEVLASLFKKITSAQVRVESFVGNGCGKIRGKCLAWSENLHRRGCKLLVVVHDLDVGNASHIKSMLEAELATSAISLRIVVVPVYEIEAWLLADHEAIERALNLRLKIKKISNPETIARPKEYLRDLIWLKSEKKKRYINTIDNLKIANECYVANLRRCTSFAPLESFIQTHC